MERQKDRPYWLNQLVGFSLTLVCTALGLAFLSISTALHTLVNYLPFELFALRCDSPSFVPR